MAREYGDFTTIRRCFDEASKRVTTGELNRFMETVEFDGDVKVKYLTQTSIRPPTFVAFTDKTRICIFRPSVS